MKPINVNRPFPAETLGEAARAAGLKTSAFVAAVVLDRRFGPDQGFDAYPGLKRLSA